MTRISIELPEARFEREAAAGRSKRELDGERMQLRNRRIQLELQRAERHRAEQEARDEEDRRASPGLFHWANLASLHAQLEDLDKQITDAVEAARADHVSWEEIGRALRVSKQAAAKRFGRPDRRSIVQRRRSH